uniref:Uncharacterized protein n=1 Tax=Anguilla anguilla TaxID=7936 RepID=A0A0E9UH48_ANGAN
MLNMVLYSMYLKSSFRAHTSVVLLLIFWGRGRTSGQFFSALNR